MAILTFGSQAKRHPIAYMLALLFLTVGVVLGAMSVSRLTPEQKQGLTTYLDRYIHTFENKPSTANAITSEQSDSGSRMASKETLLRKSVYSQGKALLAAYILGLTVFCAPAVLLVVFAKGFLMGFTVGFLVNEYLGRGALFSIAAVLPHNLILIPAVLFLSVNALAFAWETVKGPSRLGQPLYKRFVGYTMWAAAMGIVLIGASFIETYITPVFIKLVVKYL